MLGFDLQFKFNDISKITFGDRTLFKLIKLDLMNVQSNFVL